MGIDLTPTTSSSTAPSPITRPNPLKDESLQTSSAAVRETGADLGVSPSTVTPTAPPSSTRPASRWAATSDRPDRRHPAASASRASTWSTTSARSRAVAEYIHENGGIPCASASAIRSSRPTMRRPERDLRRRARRPLLLQRPFLRRLPAHDGGRDAQPGRRKRRAPLRADRAAPALLPRVRRSTSRSRTSRPRSPRSREHFADAEIDYLDGITVQLPRLAGQRPPLEHRALPAPGARGEDDPGAGPAERGAVRDSRGHPGG